MQIPLMTRLFISELIEACGNGFGELNWNTKKYMAIDNERRYYLVGSTPEEAVAKLWLALNNKDTI